MVFYHPLASRDPEALTEVQALLSPEHIRIRTDSKCSVFSLLLCYREIEKEVAKEIQGTIIGLGSPCRPDVWACSEKPRLI